MGSTKDQLADFLIGGFLLDGRFRLKRNLAIAHFIFFPLIIAACLFNFLPVTVRMLLAFWIFVGLALTAYLPFWLARAARIFRAIKLLERHGSPEDALQELKQTCGSDHRKPDVVFGSRHVFSFQTGVVLAYQEIACLQIQTEYDKPRCLRSLPTHNVLWAGLPDGKWFPIAKTSAAYRSAASLEPLQTDVAELLRRNPDIVLK